MAKTPEAAMKAKIKGYLLTLSHCWFFYPAAHGYGVIGIPDLIGCYKGRFFAIEVKAPGRLRTVTHLQQTQVNGINAAQGWAIVADDVQTVRELIALMDKAMTLE